MFSQACVKNSVHGGRGGVLPPQQTPPRQTPPPRHCSGWYESHWNAFLLFPKTAKSYYILHEDMNALT